MDFLTIENEVESEYRIQRSRFIGFLFPIKNQDDFYNKYCNIKKIYFDSTHIAFAYRLIDKGNNIVEHYSDDGEPAKTAGYPLLYILKKKKLIQAGTLVVRYFGGIKLGTGGLSKAYSTTLINALNSVELMIFQKRIDIKAITVNDKQYKLVEICRKLNANNLRIEYLEDRTIIYFTIAESNLEILKNKLNFDRDIEINII
ncbi:MAG TPA: YigZ family protein [Exilispira sp.]|nr:YigZ family protein [Exilispira sp.]